MDVSTNKLIDTFNDLITEYESGSILKNDDSIKSWTARCDWFIKRIVDIKVGTGLEYFKLQRDYSPLQESRELGEGDNDE